MPSPVIEDLQSQSGERTTRPAWHLITCEYPPQTGGVSDYTHLLATRLAAEGDPVHVWCPAHISASVVTRGIAVHQQLGTVSPADLRRVSRDLEQYPAPRRLLVQWVPHGYGYRSMNLAFCWWLWSRGRRHRDQVEAIVHEPFLSFGEGSQRQNAVGLVHRLMVILLLRAAWRVWVTVPDWERRLRPYTLGRKLTFQWLPIFSNVPVAENPDRVGALRRQYAADQILVGHFGTYGALITTLLEPLLVGLAPVPGLRILLMGQGSERYCQELVRKEPRLAHRVWATGKLPAEELSCHLSACDVMVQPYPDGVSSRRGSFLAGLSHGKPIVTTYGRLSEPFWRNTEAAVLVPVGDTEAGVSAVRRLCDDAGERHRVARAARALYGDRFDISHTVAALRRAGKGGDQPCAS